MLILASASPRRRDLLTEHGISFEIHPAEIEEGAPPYLSPGEIVLMNAQRKAAWVARRFPDSLVLGVDTVVAFQGEVLGKPADMDAAWQMLTRLNGQTHHVYSGVWLQRGQRVRGFIETTRVHFHTRSAAERRAYLERIGPLDKAGAYAAQADRGEMIRKVEGSFSNVVGLPMETLAKVLEDFR
jgi:septum formation protein